MKRILCWLLGHDWKFTIQASYCQRCGLDGHIWIKETLDKLAKERKRR